MQAIGCATIDIFPPRGPELLTHLKGRTVVCITSNSAVADEPARDALNHVKRQNLKTVT